MARRRRRRKPQSEKTDSPPQPAPPPAEPEQPGEPERRGPLVIPEWQGEAQNAPPAPSGASAHVPQRPQHQIPAVALAQFYQQVALPLSGVMAAVSMQQTALQFHPLAPPELTTRFDRFLEALTATHSHAGACLAVLQEMQESELGE